ncbi:DMT family transporter [Methylovirgula sp. 4M-Z18]|uniref:DMT family transporter n=1 Tax=Methylovirgula sp. 4M-Z18 TaxID=2293567 RepID=UPI0018F31011|nr:DMT family transporter [Methylovirgula sp. 4M-Z18]
MQDAHANPLNWQTMALVALTMMAFAANSLLCRIALRQEIIDAASFASVRLVAGAITLLLIVRARASPPYAGGGEWLAATMLFTYVVFFSFAYLTLPAGTGALILFGGVHLTMFSAGLYMGEKFGAIAWLGLALAVSGLVYLVSPGVAAPAPLGAAMMAIAGVSWGVYSLRGRGVADPLAATAGNFLRAAPLALASSVILIARAHTDATGFILALTSGALTSGVGYAIWYAALRRLSATRAATVQLSVPLIAAFGGVALLSEAITPRLLVSSAAILGGIALVLASKAHRKPERRPV